MTTVAGMPNAVSSTTGSHSLEHILSAQLKISAGFERNVIAAMQH